MALGIPQMMGDVIANKTDLSCVQLAALLNLTNFNITRDYGTTTEIVSCGKTASIMVMKNAAEGSSSQQPASCPRHFLRLCIRKADAL